MNHSLRNWAGSVVRANDGEVGTIEQLYFDDLTWRVRYMAVNTGGRKPGRRVLISMAALGKPDWEKRAFPVNLTVAQVRNSPQRDIGDSVSRQHEDDLHKHYAWPIYWSGGFYVPSGYATAMTPTAARSKKASAPGVRKVDPQLHSTGDVLDGRVHATDGDMGQVEDIVVDDETWGIRYFIVNTLKWLSDRRVPVSPTWITKVDWTGKKVFVDLSKEAVKGSPEFDPTKPVNHDYESTLLGHFQKPEVTEWVVFKLHTLPRAKVYVAGTFNNWDPATIQLGDNGKGVYTATVLLPHGRYEYKFIVNGDWINGPDFTERTPNPFGTTNNVIVVGRTVNHKAHLHTFARTPRDEARPMWRTPMGV